MDERIVGALGSFEGLQSGLKSKKVVKPRESGKVKVVSGTEGIY